MRCSKCGYYSFDYLSECKKCSTDLRETRDELGLMDLAPSVPVFLESLLEGSGGKLEGEHSTTQPEDSPEAPGFAYPSAELRIPDMAEDEVLIELIDENPQHAAFNAGVEPSLDPHEAPGYDMTGNSDGFELPGDSNEDLELDLSEDELDKLLSDIQAEPARDQPGTEPLAIGNVDQDLVALDLSDLDLDLEESVEASSKSGAAEGKEHSELSLDTEGGLELELTEDDLENLVLEDRVEKGSTTNDK